MDGSIHLIHSIVKQDIAKGRVVDVDAYCRIFEPLCPDLSRRQIEDAVLQIVIVYGGGAAWGFDKPRGGGGDPGSPQGG